MKNLMVSTALACFAIPSVAVAQDSGPKPRVLFILSNAGGRLTGAGAGTSAAAMIALAGGQNALTGFAGYKALGDEAYRIPISSTKAYSGHLIAAAGSFETIVCLQAMAAGILPATAHLTQPDPQCDLDYIAEGHRQGEIHRALNLSFGFGGANAALVLEKHA